MLIASDASMRLQSYLSDLVRINTCQPAGNEQDAVDYLLQEMAGWPGPLEIITEDHGQNRASLVLVFPGEEQAGGLAFVTHTDTVEIGDPAAWNYDPHGAAIQGDRLYGRGSADMKAGAAIMLTLAREFAETGRKPRKKVFFCFVADEERTGRGAGWLVDSGLLEGIDALLVPEPTSSELAISEKGALWLRLVVHGKTAHGSTPEHGRNALDIAMDLATAFQTTLTSDRVDERLGRGTVTLTRLEGGIATNVVPDRAVLEFDLRTLPDQDHAALIEQARAITLEQASGLSDVGIELEVLQNRPSVATAAEQALVQDLKRELDRVLPASRPLRGMAYYTDAAQLVSHLACPFVILGPGEEKKAHQPNESVSLLACENILEVFRAYLNRQLFA